MYNCIPDRHALLAEVERLRAALERVIQEPWRSYWTAREALEPPVEAGE